MIKKNIKDVKKEIIIKANATKTTIQWLITKEDGAKNFATRRIEFQPGGQIGLHDHPEEHHIYILQGQGQFVDEQGNIMEVKQGEVIYVPPNHPHGVVNNGNEALAFICVIPYL